MHRRTIAMTMLVMAAILTASALDAAASSPGIFRSRNRSTGPATTRTYRSYSVNPGSAAVPEGVVTNDDTSAAANQPAPQFGNAPSPAAARPSRPTKSKPSYMRADSKAMGRFGQ